jgi:hypothetical protein
VQSDPRLSLEKFDDGVGVRAGDGGMPCDGRSVHWAIRREAVAKRKDVVWPSISAEQSLEYKHQHVVQRAVTRA